MNRGKVKESTWDDEHYLLFFTKDVNIYFDTKSS